MKTAIVPAQVTTVEDKVAGNLGLTQLVLLVAPLFIGSGIYALFPPVLELSLFKIVATVLLGMACCSLAIRIHGELLLHWVIALTKYNSRPRYYVASRNSTFGRDATKPDIAGLEPETATEPIQAQKRQSLALSLADISNIENLLTNPSANVKFLTDKKGGMRVLVTEVEQEG